MPFPAGVDQRAVSSAGSPLPAPSPRPTPLCPERIAYRPTPGDGGRCGSWCQSPPPPPHDEPPPQPNPPPSPLSHEPPRRRLRDGLPAPPIAAMNTTMMPIPTNSRNSNFSTPFLSVLICVSGIPRTFGAQSPLEELQSFSCTVSSPRRSRSPQRRLERSSRRPSRTTCERRRRVPGRTTDAVQGDQVGDLVAALGEAGEIRTEKENVSAAADDPDVLVAEAGVGPMRDGSERGHGRRRRPGTDGTGSLQGVVSRQLRNSSERRCSPLADARRPEAPSLCSTCTPVPSGVRHHTQHRHQSARSAPVSRREHLT